MHEEPRHGLLEIDSTPKQIRFRAILFALISGLAILALKFYAAHVSDSSALRSDALEGTVNVLAAAFGLGSIIFSEKPADKDHPYGHGKIEYFASAFEGGLISLAGFLILIDTIIRLAKHSQIDDLGLGLKINIVAGLLNGVVGAIIYGVGRKYDSQVLRADGMHLLTDLTTTIFMALGLGLVLFTHWHWVDSLIAFGIAGFLLWTGFKLVRDSSNALLDAENPTLLKKIVDHINRIDRGSVITVHELRAQQFGRDQHVDIHLVIPEFFTVKQAHHASDRFAASLRKELGTGSLVHTHIDPCLRAFCAECPAADCPIRLHPYLARKPLTLESCILDGDV